MEGIQKRAGRDEEEVAKATVVVEVSVAGFLAVAVATEAAAVAIEAED